MPIYVMIPVTVLVIAAVTFGGLTALGSMNSDTTYLEFVSEEEFTITFQYTGTMPNFEYSYDGRNWTTWDCSELSSCRIYDEDDVETNMTVIYLRGSDNTCLGSMDGKNHFEILTDSTSRVYCSGNLECLLDYHQVARKQHPTLDPACFAYLFANCTALATPPECESTILSENAYYGCFEGCTSLSTTSFFYATSLAENCYAYMYNGCSTLTSVCAFGGNGLDFSYMYHMFWGCTALELVEVEEGEEYVFYISMSEDASSTEVFQNADGTGFEVKSNTRYDILTRNYKITFVTNGGSEVATFYREAGLNFTIGEEDTTEREGYVFLGWYLDEDLTQKVNDIIYMCKNYTLYAAWELEGTCHHELQASATANGDGTHTWSCDCGEVSETEECTYELIDTIYDNACVGEIRTYCCPECGGFYYEYEGGNTHSWNVSKEALFSVHGSSGSYYFSIQCLECGVYYEFAADEVDSEIWDTYWDGTNYVDVYRDVVYYHYGSGSKEYIYGYGSETYEVVRESTEEETEE